MANEKTPRGHIEPVQNRFAPTSRGSRRQIRPGEWVDDREIDWNAPMPPSKDSPPVWGPSTRALPVFDPLKYYEVSIGKTATFAGRVLAPGKSYRMVGDACIALGDAIIDAVEIGEIPIVPDMPPSG